MITSQEARKILAPLEDAYFNSMVDGGATLEEADQATKIKIHAILAAIAERDRIIEAADALDAAHDAVRNAPGEYEAWNSLADAHDAYRALRGDTE